MTHYEPNGFKFYDGASGRKMLYIEDDNSEFNMWLCYWHKGYNNWVTLRKANEDDIKKIEQLKREATINARVLIPQIEPFGFGI